MGTSQIVAILGWLMAAWLAGLALVLIVKGLGFLRGLRDMVASDLNAAANGRVSPDRVQMAAVSAFAAIVFVVRAYHAVCGPDHRMPEIPDGLLTLVAGSHAIYLSGRVGRAHTIPPEGE